MGGSSTINAMLYLRGQEQDYNNWSDQGNNGWSWSEVLPFFKKAENNIRGGDEFHGDDGPLQISNQKTPRAISQAYIDACKNMQIKPNLDFNTGNNEGAGFWQSTIFHSDNKNGERCSSSAAYLNPVLNKKNSINILVNIFFLKV